MSFKIDTREGEKMIIRDLFDFFYVNRQSLNPGQEQFIEGCKKQMKYRGGLSDKQVAILKDMKKHLQPSSVQRTTFNRIPAYNTHGTTVEKVLPSMRNDRVINITALCSAIKACNPKNDITALPTGIMLNGTEITITEGLATSKKTKYRFTDVFTLIEMLIQDGTLFAKKPDSHRIKETYLKTLKNA